MKRTGILVVSSALLLGAAAPASAADETFANCSSAINYGTNTSTYFVSSAMNTAKCDGAIIERAEAVLARQFARRTIAASNPDEIKVCFYEGLYEGWIDTLVSEYGECGYTLSLSSVSRAAVSIFTALHASLERVDNGEIDIVFDGVFRAPSADRQVCDDYVSSETEGLDEGRNELVDSVCWNS